MFFSLVLPLAAQDVLTSADAIAHHPDNDPKNQPRVSLEATVTHIDPSGTIFVADGTGATFLSRVKNFRAYYPGQVLSVKGTRIPGLFIGGITPVEIEVVGRTPPPAPHSATLQELSSGRYHYQLVSVEGIGRSVKREGETSAVLRLSVPGGIVSVRIDQASGDLDYMVDAELSVTGLAAGGIDDRRQLVDPYLMAVLPEAVEVLEDAPGTPPETTVAALLKGWDTPSHRVAVRGTALSPVLNGSIFIRDETGTMKIIPNAPVKVVPGMEVVATGFPERGPFSPFLDWAEVRPGDDILTSPHITVVDGSIITSAALDADLVTAEGILTGANAHVLTLEENEIQVQVEDPANVLAGVEPGSKVRLTGIWQVMATETGGYSARPSSFSLLLRYADDVEIVSAPPWWTPRRLAILLGVIFAAALLALVWAAMLRLQVAKQVRLIEAQTQQEAVIEERQRIAREFHDTLEQELAGLSLRLDAALPRVPDETANTLLSQLRKLLFRLQTETRDFVWDLRDESRALASFDVSLEKLVDHLRTTSPIPIHVEAAPSALPALHQHHLLRIIREAIHNAAKYSRATAIHVTFRDKSLRITDDGIGFDPASIPSGHFGLQGMRERAKKINAKLDIATSPSGGTTIAVTFP